MSAYYPIWIYLALTVACLVRLIQNRFQSKVDWILIGLIAVFYMLRFTVGPDTKEYIFAFNRVSSIIQDALTYDLQRNIGFNALLFWGKKLLKSYRWFILATNILCWVMMLIPLARYSRFPLLSLAVLLGSGVLEVYYGNGLREAIAMTIFLFAFYQFLPRRQYLPFEISMVVCGLIHEVGFIGLLIPIFAELVHRRPEKTRKVLLMLTIFSIACGIMTVKILPAWIDGLEDFIYRKPLLHVLYYLASPKPSLMGFLMEICFGIAVLVLYAWSDQRDEFTQVQVVVFLCSILIYFCFAGFSLISRVCDFFQIIGVILLPNLLTGIGEKKKKGLCFAGIIALNLVLLTEDVRFRIPQISSYDEEIGLSSNAYVTVFDSRVKEWLVE
jgi:hypothetical protein